MKAKTSFEHLADGPVRTECLRIARNLVKGELKSQGIDVRFVEASQISEAVKYLLSQKQDSDSVLKAAKDNLKRIARMKP